MAKTKAFDPSGQVNESVLRRGVRGYVSMFHRLLPDPHVPVLMDVRDAMVPHANTKWPNLSAANEPCVMIHVPCSPLQAKHPALKKAGDGRRSVGTNHDNMMEEDEHLTLESIQAADVVFPSGQLGKEGFLATLNPATRTYLPGHQAAFHPSSLAKYAPKAHHIVSHLNKTRGIALVYSAYKWTGVMLLAAALEEAGYRPSEFNTPITQAGAGNTAGPAYTVLTDGVDVSSIVTAIQSPENLDGNRIKIVLCTRKVAEGVHFTNVREVHIMDGWWNFSHEDQLTGRAVRFRSHMDLPEEHRNVTLFRYALLLPHNKESIDHEMARIAASKREQVQKVLSILSDEAFDCTVRKADVMAQLQELRASPGTGSTPTKLVTSRGMHINARALPQAHPDMDALQERMEGMCSGETLDVQAAAGAVDPSAFREVMAAAAKIFGEKLEMTRTYALADLVDILRIDEDLAVWAVTDMVQHSLPIETSDGLRAPIVAIADDEYALAHADDRTHTIVTLPLTLKHRDSNSSGSSDKLGIRHDLAFLGEIVGRLVADPDHGIVVDMAVDRALAADVDPADLGVSEGEVAESLARVDAAEGSAKQHNMARVQQDSKAKEPWFVFVAKRGAACAYMTRAAVSEVLQKANIAAPPDSSRVDICMYAEYHLRRLNRVDRTLAMHKVSAWVTEGE